MSMSEYSIVRGEASSCFFGKVARQEGREVEIHEARRLWWWEGANDLSELAVLGTAKPQDCKFSVAVDSLVMLDACEIIPCTEDAEKSIKGVPVWTVKR